MKDKLFRFKEKGRILMGPFLLCLLVASCVNKQPAYREFNLARVAHRAAKDSEAKRYSPRSYSRATRLLKMAEKALKERRFEKSAEYFRKSRYYSEKAENVARRKVFQQGDVAP